MDMNHNNIGENAGIVWRVLHNAKLSWEELLNATGLNPIELASAVGWLAREDKICFYSNDGIFYFEVFHESYL